MGTIINNIVQNQNSWRNQNLATTESAKSSGKTPEQPESPKQVTEGSGSQIHERDKANDPKDTVEIQSPRQRLIEVNRDSLENSVKDVNEAQKLLDKLEKRLNSESDLLRIEYLHDLSQENVVKLLR